MGNGIDYSTVAYWWGSLLAYDEKGDIDYCDTVAYFVVIDEDSNVVDDVGVGHCVADCIDHWRIPVLAIQGQEDQYGTLAQIDEIEARIYSPLEVAILEQCGHAPHFEQPQKTLKVIVDFTATLERLEHEQVVTAGV